VFADGQAGGPARRTAGRKHKPGVPTGHILSSAGIEGYVLGGGAGTGRGICALKYSASSLPTPAQNWTVVRTSSLSKSNLAKTAGHQLPTRIRIHKLHLSPYCRPSELPKQAYFCTFPLPLTAHLCLVHPRSGTVSFGRAFFLAAATENAQVRFIRDTLRRPLISTLWKINGTKK